MTQEELKALGLSDEQAAGVIGLYKEKLDNSFIPKSRFNEVNEENKRLKGTISERDKQLEELSKSSGDIDQLKQQKPSSIAICAFLFKPGSFKRNYKIDYIGKEIPDDFIVGYGLDYDGMGRTYRDIYVYKG
jgi:hypothetical protein